MSLTVNSGPKALYLYFTQPFNAVDIDDDSTTGTLQVVDNSIRDDLQGLKVWMSETSGFTPAAGNLVFDAGFQSIVPITDLKNNTTYYIKYAFVSKIDPDVYTTSAQTTAATLDTALPISGFLNRDPIQIPTDSDGNNAVFTNATGTFVVYNLSTNVTGTAAVTYSVVSGSSVGGVSATIASTGVYTITAITDLVGTITLRAVYTNPQNNSETYSIDLVLNVSKQRPGSTAPIVLLTSTGQAFVKAKNNGTISPSTITFDATIANIAGATYKWYADGVLINGATSSTYTLSSFNNTNSKLIKVRVQSTIVATIDVFDQMSVYYLEEGSDALNAALVNENQTVTLNAAGTVLSGLPISSQMVVARGSTILTSGVTYSLVSSSNLTNPTINSSTGIISIPTITNFALDTASATFKATVGTAELTKTLSISIVQDGRAAVINIGTVTTVSSGSNATVTNTVTDGGATNTIDISIPRGADGKVVYSARVWLQTSSAPAAPTGGNFNASTGVLTAPSGWTITQPSVSTTPTYASEYTFVVNPGTTTNTGGTWSTPFIDSVRGSDGSAQERVELYLATSDGSTPTVPTSVLYTITGAVLGTVTGGTAGWSLTMPATPANPGAVFMTTAVASSATPGTQITLGTWSTAVKVAQNGANGTSPVFIDLSNDNVSVATLANGTGGTYTSANTNVTLTSGTTDVLSSATISITPSTGVTYTYTRNGTATTGATTATNLTTGTTSLNVNITAISGQDSGTLTIVATYNSIAYTAVFTVSKAKAGSDGSPATVYEIEAGGTFNINVNTNAITPASITYSAFSTTGTAARVAYSSGSIVTERSTDGSTWTTIATTNAATATLLSSSLLTATRFVRASLYTGINGTGTLVDQESTALSVSGTDGTKGDTGAPARGVDISGGLSIRYNSSTSTYSPATLTLTAVPQNITPTTYTWSGSGATFSSTNSVSTTITPTSTSSISITVQISDGTNTAQKTITIAVANDGAAGQVGQHGKKSAMPALYTWTNSASAPTKPTTSEYYWNTVGANSAGSLTITGNVGTAGNRGYWYTSSSAATSAISPTNGDYLWELVAPITVDAATWSGSYPNQTLTAVDSTTITWSSWTAVAVGYRGTNGTGTPGTAGAGMYAIERASGATISAPTTAEVNTATGRSVGAVEGDVATVYISGQSSVSYRYLSGSWSTITTFLSGNLIVQNSIAANKLVVGNSTGNNRILLTDNNIQIWSDGNLRVKIGLL